MLCYVILSSLEKCVQFTLVSLCTRSLVCHSVSNWRLMQEKVIDHLMRLLLLAPWSVLLFLVHAKQSKLSIFWVPNIYDWFLPPHSNKAGIKYQLKHPSPNSHHYMQNKPDCNCKIALFANNEIIYDLEPELFSCNQFYIHHMNTYHWKLTILCTCLYLMWVQLWSFQYMHDLLYHQGYCKW
jgi:hypothetical protein